MDKVKVEAMFAAVSKETTRIQQGRPLAKKFVAKPIGHNLFSVREEIQQTEKRV